MPNKIDVTALVEFTPVNRPVVRTPELSFTYEPENKDYITGIQTIPTSNTQLEVGSVSEVGLIVLVNRSKQNFVDVGLTGSYAIKLNPGQLAVFPPAGDIFAQADSASCDVEFWVLPAEASQS